MELQKYLVEAGYVNDSHIVTVQKNAPDNPGDGNGLLQTGLFYCIKANQEDLSDDDKLTIEIISSRCSHHEFPIFWRSPYKKNPGDGQKCDDYWAWLAALYFAKNARADNFFQFAEEKGWVIDVEIPYDIPKPIDRQFTYYFDRFLGFRPFIKMCAIPRNNRLRISYREHAELAIASIYKIFSIGTSDGCMRDYCFFSVFARESKLGAMLAEIWIDRVRNRYGSVGLSFADYFKDKLHPICSYDYEINNKNG